MPHVIDSREWASVRYPSAIFGTEKHGVYPFERFAYDALHITTEALSAVSLPADVLVTFDADGGADPWALNAWIREAPTTGGYAIETTPFTPPVLMVLCHRIFRPMFDEDDTLQRWSEEPKRLHDELLPVAKLVLHAARTCRERGLGHALVELRDGGYTVEDLADAAHYFTGAVQFIANHEAAHAYMRQFERLKHGLSAVDLKAFEFLADLTATSWMYRRYVVNTPDTEEYRRRRGVGTHSEAIRANSRYVLESQLIVLAFLGFAEVLSTRAPARFREGPTHPHTMVRYLLQQIHFTTLVLSNFDHAFSPRDVEELDERWQAVMLLLTIVGLVPHDTEDILTDDGYFAAVRRAGELAEELQIRELQKAASFLRGIKAIPRPKVVANDAPSLSLRLDRVQE